MISLTCLEVSPSHLSVRRTPPVQSQVPNWRNFHAFLSRQDHGFPQIFGDEKPKRSLSCQHQNQKKNMDVFCLGFSSNLGKIWDVDVCLVVFTQHFKMVGFHFCRGYLTSLKKLIFGCGFGCGCFYPLNTISWGGEEYLE